MSGWGVTSEVPPRERYADDGVMVVFNDPVPVKNPALQTVLMALA
jgi:class 3 adenylate cyclase